MAPVNLTLGSLTLDIWQFDSWQIDTWQFDTCQFDMYSFSICHCQYENCQFAKFWNLSILNLSVWHIFDWWLSICQLPKFDHTDVNICQLAICQFESSLALLTHCIFIYFVSIKLSINIAFIIKQRMCHQHSAKFYILYT